MGSPIHPYSCVTSLYAPVFFSPDRGLQVGLGLSDPADAFAWMGLGGYARPAVVPLLVDAANTFGLWGRTAGADGDATVFDLYAFLNGTDATAAQTAAEMAAS